MKTTAQLIKAIAESHGIKVKVDSCFRSADHNKPPAHHSQSDHNRGFGLLQTLPATPRPPWTTAADQMAAYLHFATAGPATLGELERDSAPAYRIEVPWV